MLASLKNFLDHERPVVVALSGGVDSIVLAEMAHKTINPSLIHAIHVHHGLSENADAWASFVEEFCERRSIPLKVCRVKIDKKPRESLEDVARRARYDVLLSQSPENAQILLGHHLDDQLETMLIALKRGSGTRRLKGISVKSETNRGKTLVRPLLEFTKADIHAYAREHGLSWVEDDSNADSAFDRNFLRNEIIPLLKKRWTGLLTSTKRAARILEEENEIIELHAQQVLARVQNEGGALIISELSQLKPVEIKLAIRHWIIGQGILAPREDRIMAIYNEVALARADRKPAYHISGALISRHKNLLTLQRKED
ncbi:tRNA lysidine(34) synthetase TilS [Pseudomonas luteola]